MYLIDTDILIDYLRLYSPGVIFLDHLKTKERNISFLSQFELLQGCPTKKQEKTIDTFLKHFRVLPLNKGISMTAYQIYKTCRWNTALSIPDSFIAGTAQVHRYTLLTRNIKHFQNISSIKVKRPYE